MFKLYEKDKSMTVQLDLTDLGLLEGIVPGTILFDDAEGAVPAGLGDTVTPATAGQYYIAVDHYDNTMITSHATSPIPPSASSVQGSGKIAAVPIVETFTAVVMTNLDVSKGTEITIKNGAFAAAVGGDLVIASASKANGNIGNDNVPTHITTFIMRYVK